VPDYQLLIFDWDGTLVDSIGRIVECMRHAALGCQLPLRSDEQIKGIIGLGLPEAIASLYPDFLEDDQHARFRQHYSEYYLRLEQQPSRLFPGVAEALQAFREQGFQLAVATGKSRAGLDRLLQVRGWQDYFDITRCADETASKPHPLMLEEILEHCGVEPSRALMVGDSSFDLDMAANAGVDSVGVSYGAQSVEILRRSSPRLIIEHFSELQGWLERHPCRQTAEVN
jgi:phosphoglycolate phosphatase